MQFFSLLLGKKTFAILRSNDPVRGEIPESRLWGNKNTNNLELISLFHKSILPRGYGQ